MRTLTRTSSRAEKLKSAPFFPCSPLDSTPGFTALPTAFCQKPNLSWRVPDTVPTCGYRRVPEDFGAWFARDHMATAWLATSLSNVQNPAVEGQGENSPNPSSRFEPQNRSRRGKEAEALGSHCDPPHYVGTTEGQGLEKACHHPDSSRQVTGPWLGLSLR